MYRSIQSYISASLILLIVFTQTFHLGFLDTASAQIENYKDIITIYVDSGTYSAIKSEISTYANDIQNSLSDTRVDIHVVPTDVAPTTIASTNEKIWYEGDGGGDVGILVGTILIGDIPLPTIYIDGQYVQSVYPYTDFDDKIFTSTGGAYTKNSSNQIPSAEIWHGVISAGQDTSTSPTFAKNIGELRQYFAKNHAYYARTGAFVDFGTTSPRVFYHDAYTETAGVDTAAVDAYILSMKNIEETTYRRYTKYLATDITRTLESLKNIRTNPTEISDILGSAFATSLSPVDQISKIPDIQSEEIITNTLGAFHTIVNPKSLGEISANVRNAGRYTSGTTIAVDTIASSVNTADIAAARILLDANTALENIIDSDISTGGYARRIPIFDRQTVSSPLVGTTPSSSNPQIRNTATYRNYIYGVDASTISSPAACSIARGGDTLNTDTLGKSLLVEANMGYDVTNIQPKIDILTTDSSTLLALHRSNRYGCFQSSTDIRTRSYWGDNMPINLDPTRTEDILSAFTLRSSYLTGFSLPIYSLAGMRETARFAPLSPTDCTDTSRQYTLLDPYTYSVSCDCGSGESSQTCTDTLAYPTEWNVPGGNCGQGRASTTTPRYTCSTGHTIGTSLAYATEVSTFTTRVCTVGSLYVDGIKIKTANNPCIETIGTGEESTTVDNTKYIDQYYHTIPSSVYHKSPDDAEYLAAKNTGITPSLPVDKNRYIEFLTPKGNVARIVYPNFFRIEGNTIASFRNNLSTYSKSQWNTIISAENTYTGTVDSLFSTSSLPATYIDYGTYLSDDIISKIIQSRTWLRPDPWAKYTNMLETALSRTHIYPVDSLSIAPPYALQRSRIYDIAYLNTGYISSTDTGNASTVDTSDYDISVAQIRIANLSSTIDTTNSISAPPECGNVADGVELQKWFPAVLCWMKNLKIPKIENGVCTPKQVHIFGNTASLPISIPTLQQVQSSTGYIDFATGGTLRIASARPQMSHDDQVDILVSYQKNGKILDLGSNATISYEVVDVESIDASGATQIVYPTLLQNFSIKDYIDFLTLSTPLYTGTATNAVYSNSLDANIRIRAKLTITDPQNGTVYPPIYSDILPLRIRPDTLVISSTYTGTQDIPAGTIGTLFTISPYPTTLSAKTPYTYIFTDRDDDSYILTGSVSTGTLALPPAISARMGQYVLSIQDILGRHGTYSFTISSGPAHHIDTLTPSRTIIRGQGIPAIASILDTYNNPTKNDIQMLHIRVENGYILASSDSTIRTSEMTIPVSTGEYAYLLASDTVGTMRVYTDIVGTNIQSTYTVSVIPSAHIGVDVSAPLVVGGTGVDMTIGVRSTPTSTYISDYTGLARVSLSQDTPIDILDPAYTTTLSTDTVSLSGGISTPVYIRPGQKSGKVSLNIDIPGIGTYTGISLEIKAGKGMYSSIVDIPASGSTASGLLLTIYDRYGNISPAPTGTAYTGTVIYPDRTSTALSTVSGTYLLPRTVGQTSTRIPALYDTTIDIGTDIPTQVLHGIPDAYVQISPSTADIQILPDYNALYTVLPGKGSLSLAHKILYTTDPTTSVSLAVTTLLPYTGTGAMPIGPSGIQGYEDAISTPGIGWKGAHTALLSFAAGDSVGTANRPFQTYLSINLGDPIVSVRLDTPVKGGIDTSIGKLIADGSRGAIRAYRVADMNADAMKDIVVFYENDYVELFLNMGNRYRSRGYIARVPGAGRGFVGMGDFTADGYADIVTTTADGRLILLSNISRKISITPLSIVDTSANSSLPPPVGITQMQIYDMDADTRDDIVYLSEYGELSVLYGTPTAGKYTKNILDRTLGITLDTAVHPEGGAIYYTSLPQLPAGYVSQSDLSTSTGASDLLLRQTLYTQRTILQSGVGLQGIVYDGLSPAENTDIQTALGDIPFTTPIDTVPAYRTYVRSQYAPGYSIDIGRTYESASGTLLVSGSPVNIRVRIKNNSTNALRGIEYLEQVPQIFDTTKTTEYILKINNISSTGSVRTVKTGEYDMTFSIPDIPAGGEVEIVYPVYPAATSYGKMIVGKLETGEIGDDIYGDVGFDAKTTCGASMTMWRSTAVRTYQRGVRDFRTADIPDDMRMYFSDADADGIPDYMASMTTQEKKERYTAAGTDTSSTSMYPTVSTTTSGSARTLTLAFSPRTESQIGGLVDNIQKGLSCGFGGGSCVSFPLNWAPLAPGTSPSVMGIPLSSLVPSTGRPILSGLTGINVPTPGGCYQIPAVYPISSFQYTGTCNTTPGAGGSLGANSSSNFFRLYITPTLTAGMGMGLCLGGPASSVGRTPPQGTSPVTPGGNCLVVARPMSICREDGSISDGDLSPIVGLGATTDSFNSASCTMVAGSTATDAQKKSLRDDLIAYLRDPASTDIQRIYTQFSALGNGGISAGPVVRIGANNSAGGTEIAVDIDSSKGFAMGDIVKIKNKRVSDFPDFLMNWVDRQTEEVINKLTTLPTLYIVPPANNQNNSISSEYKLFTDKLPALRTPKTSTPLSSVSTAKNIGSSVQSLYALMQQIPYISITRQTIPLYVPWITEADIDKHILNYTSQAKQYQKEISDFAKSFCATPETNRLNCLNNKAYISAGGLVGDILHNIKMLQEYKRFPKKLEKYLSWKQKYLYQLSCNIRTIQQISGGWMAENGKRFKKWVEFIILTKAILKSWQPMIDLFAKYQKECAVCRNERYDLKYFQFKIISAVIPQLPVIRFPKWPDIVLDLSDIRMGLSVSLPEFQLVPVPISVPTLPRLTLPRSPSATFSFGRIYRLPPIPPLPDLPDMPSLPRVTLPDLPPPPKLPKMFASITGVIKILDIVRKVMCLNRKELWVPEWRVGDVIAQRTERQGTMGMDFLSLDFPQYSIPGIREIKIATHINLSLKTDFITDIARKSVEPINKFSSTSVTQIPTKVGTDVNISSPLPTSTTVQVGAVDTTISTGTSLFAILGDMQGDADTQIDIDTFTSILQKNVLQMNTIDTAPIRNVLVSALEESESTSRTLLASLTREQNENMNTVQTTVDTYIADSERIDREMIANIGLSNYKGSIINDEGNTEYVPLVHIAAQGGIGIDSVYAEVAIDEKSKAESIGNVYIDNDTIDTTRISSGLTRSISRIYADATSPNNVSNFATPSPNGSIYAPNFQGIYVLDDNNNQTRLLDMVDDIPADMQPIIYDADGDGDRDFLIQIGDRLYLKSSRKNVPSPRPVSTPPRVVYLDTPTVPTAPDSFRENTPDISRVDVSFVRTYTGGTLYVLDIMDRYLDADAGKISGDTDIARSYTVLAPTAISPVPTATGSTFTSTPVPAYIEDIRGTVDISGPVLRTLSAGSTFTLSSGKSIYTGRTPARVETLSGAVSTILQPYTVYTIGTSADISIVSGRVYVRDPSVSRATRTGTTDIVGMPVLPDMVYTPKGENSHIDIYHTDSQTSLRTLVDHTYHMLSIPDRLGSVPVSFPLENGYYTTRIYPIGTTVRTGPAIFAPADIYDVTPPDISLSADIRIPVYTTTDISLRDYISDDSPYILLWDMQPAVDTDGDGRTDNDWASTYSGQVAPLGTPYTLRFGPFDTVEKKKVRMMAIDDRGYSSTADVVLDIYAPVPTLDTATLSGYISGSIPQDTAGEPIHIVRTREGENKTLTGVYTTTDTGTYSGRISGSTGDILVRDRGDTIAKILDNGNILLQQIAINSGYTISAQFASGTYPPSLRIVDGSGYTLYTQYMSPSDTVRISPLSQTGDNTVSVSPLSGYTYIPNSLSTPQLPGGGYIVDRSYTAVVGIDRRGSIYQAASTASMRYRYTGGQYILDIYSGDIRIASVLYRMQGVYTTGR